MREIKFRAWWIEKNEMIYVVGVKPAWKDNSEWTISGEGFFVRPDCDKVILMQFTGLRDKYGEDIFEGDIVETPLGFLVEVGFYQGGFALFNKKADENCPITMMSEYYPAINGQLKKVGTIYENPKLLESK